MDLEARTKNVTKILTRWRELNLNEGWVSGMVLREWDAGGDQLEAVFARLRAQGMKIEEARFGRFGSMHYRLARGEEAA